MNDYEKRLTGCQMALRRIEADYPDVYSDAILIEREVTVEEILARGREPADKITVWCLSENCGNA